MGADKGRESPEASVSGGRAVWFPQTTLNDVADKNLEWGTETEYGQRTVNQRGGLRQSTLRQRQTQLALFHGEQQGWGWHCRQKKLVTGPGRSLGVLVHLPPHDTVICDS